MGGYASLHFYVLCPGTRHLRRYIHGVEMVQYYYSSPEKKKKESYVAEGTRDGKK